MFKEISINRTVCYGTCPVYTAVINDRGEVHWQGEAFVYHIGEARYKVSKSNLDRIRELLEKFDYRSFIYPKPDIFATDMPLCITKVMFEDGFINEIHHNHGDGELDHSRKHSLKNLKTFEDTLEQLLGLKEFIGDPKEHSFVF